VLLFILATAEIQQSLRCPKLLTPSNKLVTTQYDCLKDGSTINPYPANVENRVSS